MRGMIRQFKETLEIRSTWSNRIRSHRYFGIALLVLTLITASFIHIWQRVVVLDLLFEVGQLKQDNIALADDARKIYSDISMLSMASRIDAYATDTLGLIRVPAERLYTLVPSDKKQEVKDDLVAVVSAVKRIARHAPMITRSSVQAGEICRLNIDSLKLAEGNR